MKLVKQKYYTATGEAKVNCYKITVAKQLLEESGIKEDDDLEMTAEKGKIIIKKKAGD